MAHKTEKNKKNRKTFYERFVKRFLDVVLSFFALIILSPLFLIIAILSKIFIGGRIIFHQYRPGKDGKIFNFYKFKSMKDIFDENGELLPDSQRITKFGKVLRKTSLDELPQLINILRGDMSIVGPRPRLVKDMVFYDKESLKGYSVRPGLTGLDQVSGGRSESSWEFIFEKNIEYQNKITFLGDVKIIFQTVLSLFKGGDSAVGGAGQTTREYYYCDYLLKNNKITQQQYDMGLAYAKEVIAQHGKVEYYEELHNETTDENQNK